MRAFYKATTFLSAQFGNVNYSLCSVEDDPDAACTEQICDELTPIPKLLYKTDLCVESHFNGSMLDAIESTLRTYKTAFQRLNYNYQVVCLLIDMSVSSFVVHSPHTSNYHVTRNPFVADRFDSVKDIEKFLFNFPQLSANPYFMVHQKISPTPVLKKIERR